MLDSKRTKIYYKVFFIIVVYVLVDLLTYALNPNSIAWKDYWTQPAWDIFERVATGFAQSWAIIEGSIWIAKVLDRYIGWSGFPTLRYLIQIVLVVVFAGITMLAIDFYYVIMYGNEKLSAEQDLHLWQYFVVSLLVSIFVSTISTGYGFLRHWQASILEATQLKVEAMELKETAMQAELQSLKLQLDPHFMFNNFSTLSDLIHVAPKEASLFLDNLSRVYRYMVLNLKKDLVPLKDELQLLTAFSYLIDIRHGKNVQIQMDIPEAYHPLHIPPISLQLLVENAIKHNRATPASPLRINITVDAASTSVVVENNLQPIPYPLESSKLGLENIRNRYRLLSDRVPEIYQDEEIFKVSLPLLN
ncbi:MAG: histidine kinase [Chitinophaga sp.]|uniref:sensor histidine kinase n=1 Tax=Chitinophaga sp. TaxID=1869181 RepID=UPI0025B97B54|nr:histidine kinase [Chitinophaga sp.]MBV8253107.1 histidine kinase [Chitinophaga sp.]